MCHREPGSDTITKSTLGMFAPERAVECVCLCICLLVSHACVSLGDVLGELVPSKIFNPPFPVLKARHSVSYLMSELARV